MPQPKFATGDKAIVTNARLLLTDAKSFVESVTDPTNPKRVILDDYGNGYWGMFKSAFAVLSE